MNRETKPSQRWLWIVVLLLLGNVSICGLTVYMALRSNAQTPAAYRGDMRKSGGNVTP